MSSVFRYLAVDYYPSNQAPNGKVEEIDRALGKKENVDIWLEGDKIVAEVY